MTLSRRFLVFIGMKEKIVLIAGLLDEAGTVGKVICMTNLSKGRQGCLSHRQPITDVGFLSTNHYLRLARKATPVIGWETPP